MKENLELLIHMARKLESEGEFIASALKKYQEYENVSEQEVRSRLNCSKEDYYKLTLCKTPDIEGNDFVSRLHKISQYSNTSIEELNRIIKRVASIERLGESGQQKYLMAARDKHKKK
ncbi:MAG: hypothetical protein JST14_07590 [Bacteroidetes bacterium]|nr:hypothetical protein [Bacteroidota bacterium]